MDVLLAFLTNKFDESKNEFKTKLAETETNLNTRLNETETNLNTRLNETKTEIQNYQQIIESQISEIRRDQNNFRQEISEILTIQANQADEISKLNTKFDAKIAESQKEITSLLDENMAKHQRHIEKDTQLRHSEILNTVSHELNVFNAQMNEQINTLTQQTRADIELQSKSHINTIHNEVLPKLGIQQKLIESQQAEIQNINQAINHHEQELKTLKQQPPLSHNPAGPIQIICPGSEWNDRQLPKFNGRANNPNEYLQRLKRYYDKSLERNQPKDTAEHLKDILESSFEGPASRWLQLIKHDLTCWEKFSNEFLGKYWNRDIQRGIKSKIENERYRNNGTLTRTEYFTEKVLLLKSVTPAFSEEEIVTTLADRFGELIQDSINVQNITTIRDFERLLQKEDLRDGPKKNKNNSGNPHNQNYRPNSPTQTNKPNYQNGREYNFQAYQPKPYFSNHNKPYYQSPSNQNPNHQNYRSNHNNNYRPNHQAQYRNHYNDKPYNREYQNLRPNPQNSQSHNRPYPTEEQNQVCSIIRQNAPPPRSPSHERINTQTITNSSTSPNKGN